MVTANDLQRISTESEATVEECFDGDFVGGIHGGRHGTADSKRLVPEMQAREAIMVGLARRLIGRFPPGPARAGREPFCSGYRIAYEIGVRISGRARVGRSWIDQCILQESE